MEIEKIFEVLLVEDNPADVRLTKEALSTGLFPIHLSVVGDGVEAMDFLYKRGKYSHVSTPSLILLDLNLPRKNGREVLEEIKNDEILSRIPVVVLTTSQSEDDVCAAYRLHANCYITKPVDFDQFMEIINSIEKFWLATVKLPVC